MTPPAAPRFWGWKVSDVLFGRSPARRTQTFRPWLERLEDRNTPTSVPFITPAPISITADGAQATTTADVDGDGDTDVLSASLRDDTIAWYENTAGDGFVFTPHTIATSPDSARSVWAADVDGDGDMDVLSASVNDDKVAWYENTAGDGSAFTPHTISSSADGAVWVTTEDVDGDGDLDVLSASYYDDKIAWYENTAGDGSSFTLHTISTTANGARLVTTADVDGDGDIDVLSASIADNKIAWYENSAGDGSAFTLHTISTTAIRAFSVTTADVDGDGDTDVLSASSSDSKIAWYENTAGNGSAFILHTISSTTNGARSVTIADVDGDGDIDVLSAAFYDDKIAWYENTEGNGSAFTPHTISTGANGAESVTIADVDGDGDIDVLSASYYDNRIAWYRNDSDQSTPLAPVVTGPMNAVVLNAATRVITGQAEANALVRIYRDNNDDGQINGEDGVVASQQLSGGATAFSIAAPLTQGGASNFINHFLVTAVDAASNESVPSDVPDITEDSTAPTVTVEQAVGQADPTSVSPIRFTIAFSEPVTGFNAAAVTLGGSAGATTVTLFEAGPLDGTTYLAEVSGMSQAGTVHVSLAGGVVSDVAGNGNAASTSSDNVVQFGDTTAPAAPVVTSPASPITVNADTQNVVGVAEANALVCVYRDNNNDGQINGADAVVASQQLSGGATSFSIAAPLTQNTFNNFVVTATDGANNQSAPADVPDIIEDSTAPTVTVNQSAGQAGATFNPLIRFSIVFSEAVTGFSAADVTLSGSAGATTKTLFEAGPLDGTTYLVEVSGLSHAGTVLASVAAGVASDAAGNGNAASSSSDNLVLFGAVTATGSDAGGGTIRVFDAVSGQQITSFSAYNAGGYTGGARVALADVNGDAIPDVITASGPGLAGGALVKVFDGTALLNGTTTELFNFRPHGTTYTGELFIAAGDFNNDNRADLVTGNAPTAGPVVKVFDAADLAGGDPVTELGSMHPFGATYKGGARVAVGDVNGDGTLDVIAAQSKNSAQVRALSGVNFSTVLMKVTVSRTVIAGGVFVSAGNTDGDNRVDIIVGLGAGGKSIVQVYEDASNADTRATLLKKSAPIYATTFKGGVRVAATDLNGDGLAEVMTTAGTGLSSYRLRVLNGLTLAALDAFFSQAPDFTDARFVVAARL